MSKKSVLIFFCTLKDSSYGFICDRSILFHWQWWIIIINTNNSLPTSYNVNHFVLWRRHLFYYSMTLKLPSLHLLLNAILMLTTHLLLLDEQLKILENQKYILHFKTFLYVLFKQWLDSIWLLCIEYLIFMCFFLCIQFQSNENLKSKQSDRFYCFSDNPYNQNDESFVSIWQNFL